MGRRQRDGDGLDGGWETGETNCGTALFSNTQKYPPPKKFLTQTGEIELLMLTKTFIDHRIRDIIELI